MQEAPIFGEASRNILVELRQNRKNGARMSDDRIPVRMLHNHGTVVRVENGILEGPQRAGKLHHASPSLRIQPKVM